MSERILAVCEGDAGAFHHRAAAAAGLAQTFANESRGDADILLVGGAPPPPGRWDRAWRLEGTDCGLLDATARLVAENDYRFVAFGDTPLSRDVAGRLAVRLDLPVVGSVLNLRRRNGALIASRPAVAGTRTANLAVGRFPALLVVSPDAAEAPSVSTQAVEVHSLATAVAAPRFTLLHEERLSPSDMEVTEADVVVAGGRGVGSKEGFDRLTELAGLLGGSVGASRVAVDL